MSEAVTLQTIQQNTLKRVRKTLAQQKVLQNTFKPMREALTYQTIKRIT